MSRPQLPHALLQEAAQWFVELQDGAQDPAREQRWRAWLVSSPAHAQAWQQLQSVWRSCEGLPGEPSRAALERAAQRGAARRQALRRMGAGLGMAAGLWLGWPQGQAWLADYRSALGEVRDWTLPDGSQLWLNSASAVNLAFDAGGRGLRLLQGELLLHSAPEQRPWHIATAWGDLQAPEPGERLRASVLSRGEELQLNVFEGRLMLAAAPRGVAAGEQLRLRPGEAPWRGPAQDLRRSWQQGLLVAQELPLAEVVQELAQRQRGYLACAPEVAGLRLVGTFPLQDVPLALQALSVALPVRIHRPLPWWTTVEAA